MTHGEDETMTANATIERSPGLGIGLGFIVGGGYTGATETLDEVVSHAAETLREAYGADVVIRFNSDRRSGGAWLKTDDPDGVWLNAEVGICAAQGSERVRDSLPEDMRHRALAPDEIAYFAHVGKRVGEYAHARVDGIAEALAYVQTHADLAALVTAGGNR